MLAASYFGYVDEFDQWCMPPWRKAAKRTSQDGEDSGDRMDDDKRD